MNYEKTLNFLYSKFPIYQRDGLPAYKKNLDNINTICDYIHNPEKDMKFIHIGGTNGKGSTSNMLSNILQKHKFKTGLYTSPHYYNFRERIQVDGKKISKNFIINFVKKIKPIFKKIKPSFFEITVALAFAYFKKQKTDIAIIEVGLGGKLDSTNIILPIISVITNISLDHTNILGKNIKKIAYEKAGIIKYKTPVIIGRKQKEVVNIFINKAKKKKTKLFFTKNYNLKIKPRYKNENANTTISILELLKKLGFKIDIKYSIKEILKQKNIIGRWNIIKQKPLIILDSAHNIDGFKNIIKEINNIKYDNLHIIFGCSDDKNIKEFFKIFPKKANYYFCQANVIRAYKYLDFKNTADKFNLNYQLIKNPIKALKQAERKSKSKDLIIMFGSIFIIGEVLQKFCDV